MADWLERAGVIRLSTGREIEAAGKVLGMRVDGRFQGEFDWNAQPFFSGHDESHMTRELSGVFNGPDFQWTEAERQELAEFMCACWQAWAKGYGAMG
jgi:hypothetical protein